MLAKPQIAIQPQIALFSVILTATCAYAAYNEKYVRDQENIDGRLQQKYYADMKDAQAKIPKMTETIRGKDLSLDSRMDKLVWGGKAKLDSSNSAPSSSSSSSSSSSPAAGPADDWDDEDDDDYSSASDSSSSSGSDSSSSGNDDDENDENMTPEQEAASKRARRRERRRKKREKREKKRAKKKLEEDEAAAASKRLAAQSMAAGVTIGAVAMAATFLFANRRK